MKESLLSPIAPIHCVEPTNDLSLSPSLTSVCWISLWLGDGFEVYCCIRNQEQIVCSDLGTGKNGQVRL